MPPRLGYWPAAVALVVFAWLELVYPHRDEPYTVLVFLVLYAWVQLVAAFRYGPAWYARGDARSTPPWWPACARSAGGPTAAWGCATRWPGWPPSGRRRGCWR